MSLQRIKNIEAMKRLNYISRKSLAIWMLSGALFSSIVINILLGNAVNWLKKPYNYQVLLNYSTEQLLESINNTKQMMLIEFLKGKKQAYILDSIQKNLNEEYDYIRTTGKKDLARRYFKGELPLGGEE